MYRVPVSMCVSGVMCPCLQVCQWCRVPLPRCVSGVSCPCPHVCQWCVLSLSPGVSVVCRVSVSRCVSGVSCPCPQVCQWCVLSLSPGVRPATETRTARRRQEAPPSQPWRGPCCWALAHSCCSAPLCLSSLSVGNNVERNGK